MLWFYGISFLLLGIGTGGLMYYVMDPAVDGDGTSFFGVVLLSMAIGVYATAAFVLCAAIRGFADWSATRRAIQSGTII